nr:ethylene-insensitive protein 2 [Ipomoea batatas]
MESETLAVHYQPDKLQRLLSTIVPVLLIAVGYVDPGKWAVFVEGGARFGVDLMIVLLLFNLGAILCQYLSARIAVVTGRDLAQICSEEYDKVTCIFLGVQAEISVIALDLTMVLGTAYGLKAVFGFDLLSCIFLTATNAVLLPLISSLVDNVSARFLSICWASFILLSYVIGMIISQPENPLSMDGMLTKLNGDSAFALMSLLGASIMPHNFYLHSSIRDQGSKKLSKEALCNDHFFAIVCIFSGIFLVNYVLVNSAASVFYNSTSGSSGLVLLTFQDALSLHDQVFRSSLVTFVVVLVMFFSNQITALTWDLGKQAVVHDLFGMELPGWLHHVTVRIMAIVPALYCVWTSGAEGLYQMLLCTQVGVALVLPSAVIPLFRVASSRSIMGVHKISPLSELLSLGTFFGLLGLKIIFVTEMVFGDSEWVSYLKWNIGSSVSVPYVVLLVAAFSSLGLMLWLAATPMKSASSTFDPQALYWDIRTPVPESPPFGDKVDVNESRFNLERSTNRQEPTLQLGKLLGSHSNSNLSTPYPEPNLPETLPDFETFPHLTTIDENKSEVMFPNKSKCDPELSISAGDTVPRSTVYDDVSAADSAEDSSLTSKPVDVVEKTLHIEGDNQNDKDNEGDSWVPEEVTKEVSANSQFLSFEGPGSFKSISGKNDDIGNGTGSLSRLGLGRAARRHLTVVLDEFWGQLFDSHGQATQEAKSKKLDILLGVESKMDPKPPSGSLKLESIRKESNAYISSMSGLGSDLLINSNLYSHKQQMGKFGDESAYVAQKDPYSSQSAHLQLLDAYVRSLSHDTLEAGERRYSSMHIPTSSSGYDQQPATIHGFELAYLNRIANERRTGYSNGKVESPIPKSKNLITPNSSEFYPSAYALKPQSSLSSRAPPGFGNVPTSRNTSLQSGNNLNDLNPSGNAESIGCTASAKKFHSSPDIKKLYVPNRESLLLERSAQRDSSMGYVQSSGRSPYERLNYLSPSQRVGGPPGFDQPSPSKVPRDAIPLQFSSNPATGSLWARQPFEQFGGTAKSGNIHADRFGAMQSSFTREAGLMMELEARLLQSFRSCIAKLLKLEGSEWLFRLDDGVDEDLVYGVATRERFLYEAEMREINAMGGNIGESPPNRKPGSASKTEEFDCTKFLMTSIPHCGEGCIWKLDLIVSFGIWCIHRILELSLTESRPELWGKYTYVLNRLQGIIDLAFFKPRSPMTPCLCLSFPVGQQQRSNMSAPNGSLAMPAKQGRGKCTTAPMLVEKIKDIEIAISSRKGRAGTAAGDVAFPRGKENLASVLKRYKRRLSNKAVGFQELRNVAPSTPY